MSAFYVLLRIDLHFPDAGSLKAKRAELKPVKAALRDRLGLSVAEVGHQDSWQRSTLAAAMPAGSARRAEEAADATQRWLDARLSHGARIERVVASWTDLESLG